MIIALSGMPFDALLEFGMSNEPEYGGLAEVLRVARQKAGLTQQELADRLGVECSLLVQYEEGRRTIPDSHWQRLRQILSALEHIPDGPVIFE